MKVARFRCSSNKAQHPDQLPEPRPEVCQLFRAIKQLTGHRRLRQSTGSSEIFPCQEREREKRRSLASYETCKFTRLGGGFQTVFFPSTTSGREADLRRDSWESSNLITAPFSMSIIITRFRTDRFHCPIMRRQAQAALPSFYGCLEKASPALFPIGNLLSSNVSHNQNLVKLRSSYSLRPFNRCISPVVSLSFSG